MGNSLVGDEQSSSGVMRFGGTHTGECYIVGKGSSVDGYVFKSGIPKIGINDVGVVYSVDYAILGPDMNEWLDRSKIWEKCEAVFTQFGMGNEHTVTYYKTKKYTQWDNFLHFRDNTVSLAISLAKMMGFDKATFVGFGDKWHSKHWLKTVGRRKLIDDKTLTHDDAYGFEGTQKELIKSECKGMKLGVQFG
jgi:hypothetical protein